MIEGIEIERFRCFHHSKFEGFKQVNLIGGQNNSGKTSLLEAIFLAISGEPNRLNYFGIERFMNWNELIWNIPEQGNCFIKAIGSDSQKLNLVTTVELNITLSNQNAKRLGDNLSEPRVMSSVKKILPSDIAQDFDKATRGGKDYIWVEGFNCIDTTIEILRSFTISSQHRLYIRKKGEKVYNNISHLGDAIYKISEVIAHISQNEGGILLIDEIENGIHYTHHEAFWEMLLKLAKEFNVQVFATTHSLEMIKAFNKVALEKGFEETSQYMEMFRSARSNEIVAHPYKHSTLAYSLLNNLPFRGEDR